MSRVRLGAIIAFLQQGKPRGQRPIFLTHISVLGEAGQFAQLNVFFFDSLKAEKGLPELTLSGLQLPSL